MVQDQLVEYVSSQLKLGVSRDAVKASLTSVGWAPLDVEDTLKKVEGGIVSAPAQPAVPQKAAEAAPGTAAMPKIVSFSMPGTATGQMKNAEPQGIRVSDLVSGIAPATSTPAGTAPRNVSSGTPASPAKGQFSKGSPSGILSASSGRKKMGLGLWGIVAIVLIVAIGAFAGYLFVKNSALTGELQAVNGQSQGATQSSAAKVQALDASNTVLAAQVTSLMSENQNLATSLSLLVAPASSSSTASEPVSVSGMLAAGLSKNTYVITTPYGVKVNIKNSSDSAVAAALQPLLGNTIMVSGMYIPGTPNITLTSVNGSPVSPPPAATTTSATMTAPVSTSTPAKMTTTTSNGTSGTSTAP